MRKLFFYCQVIFILCCVKPGLVHASEEIKMRIPYASNLQRFRLSMSDYNLHHDWYCREEDKANETAIGISSVFSNVLNTRRIKNHQGEIVSCTECPNKGQSVFFTQKKKQTLISKTLPAVQKYFSTHGPLFRRKTDVLDLPKKIWDRGNPLCHYFKRPPDHDAYRVNHTDAMVYIAAAPFLDHSDTWCAACTIQKDRFTSLVLNLNPCFLDNNDEEMKVQKIVETISQNLWSKECPKENAVIMKATIGTKTRYVCLAARCVQDQPVMIRLDDDDVWRACEQGESILTGSMVISCPNYNEICREQHALTIKFEQIACDSAVSGNHFVSCACPLFVLAIMLSFFFLS